MAFLGALNMRRFNCLIVFFFVTLERSVVANSLHTKVCGDAFLAAILRLYHFVL